MRRCIGGQGDFEGCVSLYLRYTDSMLTILHDRRTNWMAHLVRGIAYMTGMVR